MSLACFAFDGFALFDAAAFFEAFDAAAAFAFEVFDATGFLLAAEVFFATDFFGDFFAAAFLLDAAFFAFGAAALAFAVVLAFLAAAFGLFLVEAI